PAKNDRVQPHLRLGISLLLLASARATYERRATLRRVRARSASAVDARLIAAVSAGRASAGPHVASIALAQRRPVVVNVRAVAASYEVVAVQGAVRGDMRRKI